MKHLTSEMIEKAKAVKSAEELLALAKENNVEMTADEAATYFAQLNPQSGELDDDALNGVAGGGCAENKQNKANEKEAIKSVTCPHCGKVGDFFVHMEVVDGYIWACSTCRLIGTINADDGYSVFHNGGEFVDGYI